MRKNILLVLFILFAPGLFGPLAFGQGIVKGTLRESQSPLEFANVLVYDQADSLKPVKSTLSDSLGNFSLTGLAPGNYLLKVELLGQVLYHTPFNLSHSSEPVELGKIDVNENGQVLGDVEVVSRKDIIKKTSHGFIINAKDNLTQGAGTATDLLKNTPSVAVDADGNITIRGKSPLILVNGRNSVLGATDRIPASSVESIEIINNPTAQYDADADGGIISIRLKKNTANGTNGSIALGAGYGAKGRANSAIILNHQQGKWNQSLAYDNRFAGRTRKAEANRTDFNLPDQYYLWQHRHDNRLEQTHNLKYNLDYNGKKNTWGLEAIGNLESEDNLETLVSQIENQQAVFQSKNSRFSSEHVREKAMEYALNYAHNFEDKRKNLSMNLSSSFNFDQEHTDITTQSLNVDDSESGNPFLQRTRNDQNSNVSNFRIDYANPVGKTGTLETGYKAIYRYTDADFKNQYYSNDQYIINPLASNVFHFREQVHAAYVQYRNTIGHGDTTRWNYDIGLRTEQVYNHGFAVANNLSVKRAYFNFFPTANLVRYFKQNDFVKLSFSRRINRPNLGQLNPFVDITDSLNQHGGNPYLRPELVNAVETGYNKEWKKVSFSVNLYYRYATNLIRPYILLQPNGVALTQPMNFGHSITYGLEGMATFFINKYWDLNASFSIYQQLIDGSNVSADLANKVLSGYGKLINNFTLWKGSRLQVIGNYTAPVATPQGSRIAVYFADLGFQQKVLKGRGALGLVVTDVFNTQKSGTVASAPDFTYARKFKVDTRAVLVTFTLSFKAKLKEELLENKFSND